MALFGLVLSFCVSCWLSDLPHSSFALHCLPFSSALFYLATLCPPCLWFPLSSLSFFSCLFVFLAAALTQLSNTFSLLLLVSA